MLCLLKEKDLLESEQKPEQCSQTGKHNGVKLHHIIDHIRPRSGRAWTNSDALSVDDALCFGLNIAAPNTIESQLSLFLPVHMLVFHPSFIPVCFYWYYI